MSYDSLQNTNAPSYIKLLFRIIGIPKELSKLLVCCKGSVHDEK